MDTDPPGKSLAVVFARARLGVEAPLVSVEVHLTGGLPRCTIVGLPAAAVRESIDRVRGALMNSGFEYPTGHITVNLAPADLLALTMNALHLVFLRRAPRIRLRTPSDRGEAEPDHEPIPWDVERGYRCYPDCGLLCRGFGCARCKARSLRRHRRRFQRARRRCATM